MIMSAIVVAVIVLGGLGVVGALVLYLVSKRFYVKEDPRIELIEQLLPGANCGSCGRLAVMTLPALVRRHLRSTTLCVPVPATPWPR